MPIIGVDIGGTKIRAILWNGRRVVRAREVPTPKDKSAFARSLAALISFLCHRKSVDGIGIGAAGIVERSTLLFSPNIPYLRNFDFRSVSLPSCPLRVDNDARAFGRAELLRGAGREAKRLFVLTIGTGVGRAYGRNGKIVKLKRLEYPERWEKEYQHLRDMPADRKLANFLGEKLSLLLQPFDPGVIVIGGGVMERRGFLQKLETAFKARGLSAKIKRATFRKNGAALGAALLFSN